MEEERKSVAKEPTEETKSLISKLFRTYSSVSKEEERKKDPGAFFFDIHDYIFENTFIDNYLNKEADHY